MIKKSILILILIIFSCKKDKNSNSYCMESYINNEFSNAPFGKINFRKIELKDTIFKNTIQEERFVDYGKENYKEFLTFYTGSYKNKYSFIKISKANNIFILSNAIIRNNNTTINILYKNKKIGVNYSKEKICEILNIHNVSICDSLIIMDDKNNNKHIFYFKNNLLNKIILSRNLN